jgi:hypothetical protein
MLTQKQPLKRTRLRRISPERAAENREYAKRKAAYLVEHPLDMVAIAMAGLDEAEVVAHYRTRTGGNPFSFRFDGHVIPVATQVHHRLKRHGARLLDERWWMATASASHDLVENRKDWARAEGYLLPIQADAEGRWGAGNQALVTSDLMRSKVRR